MSLYELLPQLQKAMIEKFGGNPLPDSSYRAIMRRVFSFLNQLSAKPGFNRFQLHSCHLRQVYSEPDIEKYRLEQMDLDETRTDSAKKWRSKIEWERDGVVVPLRIYRPNDVWDPEMLERLIPKDAVALCYQSSSLQRNWAVGRRRIANYIMQRFLDEVVLAALRGEVVAGGGVYIYVDVIDKDKEKVARKRKTHFFHSKGRMYGLVLKTWEPDHRYHLRMTARMRWHLYDLIKNQGYRYER